MLAAVMARDRAADGRFLFGVVSTGIYCLPSCKARNPKPENVRFFPDEETAREAGLRPCKRCRPGDFYRRRDPDREALEAAVETLRANPGELAGVGDLARGAGMGASKLHTLVRLHYHTTPGRLATDARMAAARRLLLETDLPVTTVAYEVGYESLSAFHDNFLRGTGMSPGAYRRLPGARSFEIRLAEDFPLAATLARLGRNPDSLTERVRGHAWLSGARLAGVPTRMVVELAPGRARIDLGGASPLPDLAAVAAHTRVLRCLGLATDPAPFVAQTQADPALAPLVAPCPGLRVLGTGDAFECLVWAIVGQQVNLTFAFRLMRRVVELAGEEVEDGLATPPLAERVAALTPGDLTARQFSRSKAEYLLGAAERVATGSLDLDGLAAATATRAEAELLAVRGLGPWTAGYVLMRGLGFTDAVPWGDSGLLRGLARFFGLAERPDRRLTEELLEPFRPYRGHATFHFWQLLEKEG